MTRNSIFFLAAMTPTVLSAQMISSDSERILASEKIPFATIQAKNWITRFPKIIKASSDSKKQITTLHFKLDHGKVIRDNFPYVYGENPAISTVKLDLNLPPEKYVQYNQLSCWVYPDVPDRASLWIEMGGSGIWTQACRPMRPRQWNKITVTWSNHKDPAKMRKIKSFVISKQMTGRLPGDPEWANYYFKDFTLERVVPGTEDGWHASEEKIIVPQTGFSPAYAKWAVLSSKHKASDFELIDAKTGKTVYKRKLSTEKYPTGEFKIAHFSRFMTEGTYRVKSGNLLSVPFEISFKHLNDLTAKNANFLFSMRSGMKTPAHPACFLEPVLRSDNKQPVDISGGWFDASDLRGYHSMAIKTIMRPLAVACNFNVPAAYNELLWGTKFMTKLYDPKSGLPFTVHSLYPLNNPDKKLQAVFRGGHFIKVNNFWTDNIPNSGDERVVHVAQGTYICHPDVQDSHWGMTAAGAYFYLAAKDTDKALAKKVLAQAKKHFDMMCDANAAELKKMGIGPYAPHTTLAIGMRLENAVLFWKATGGTYYREMAFELADELLKRQQRMLFKNEHGYLCGLFCENARKDTAHLSRDNMGIYALTLLAKEIPGTERAFRIHAALRIFADFHLKNHYTQALPYTTPFADFREKPRKNWFSVKIGTSLDGKRNLYGELNNYFLSGINGTIALQTQALAAYFNDIYLQNLAASYLTFHTGHNPSGRSFIAEVGTNYRRDIMSSFLGWIPGMMSNPDMRNCKGIPTLPYNRHHGANEIYTQTQAGYAAASAILNAPAKLTFNLKNVPAGMKLFYGSQIDDVGKLKTIPVKEGKNILELPGGIKYIFAFSTKETLKQKPEVLFIENVISGEVRNTDIDFRNYKRILRVFCPKEVKQGETATIRVAVMNFGTAPAKIKLSARGENLKLEQKSVEKTVQAKKGTFFKFRGKPVKKNEPFVFMVYPAGEPEKVTSVSGVSL
ncbi:MAG: glycoside hydrolase family 9 protein [Lentisphaeria bacterium]|nr:glycoside hydrolase family 9 protein [Lentisphaeria bacterium]